MAIIDLLRRVKRTLMPSRSEIDPFPLDAWTDPSYADWFERHKVTPEEIRAQRSASFMVEPKFSIIVPLFRTPIGFLRELVDSVLAQTYPEFELLFVNASPDCADLRMEVERLCMSDARVLSIELADNLGIAENTNAGIRAASGDFVCFLDHDDLIEPNALFEYARLMNDRPETDLIYSDEDLVKVDAGGDLVHMHPFFKPGYSLEALLCTNYVLHFLAVRKSVLADIHLADSSFDGTQDYCNILSVIRRTDRVEHVPKVLYHWRICEGSTAADPDAKPYDRVAARRSIGRHVSAEAIDAQIIGSGIVNTQNLWFRPGREKPIVSVIVDAVASDDARDFLELFSQTNGYHHAEVIIVLEGDRGDGGFLEECKVVHEKSSSRFARFNAGAEVAAGEYLVFMDANASFQTPEPIEQLLGMCKREGVGVVAPKSLYSDGSVRCYGIAVTRERIMPLYRGYPDDFPGYQCNTRAFQNNSAASYLGLMTSKRLFDEVGGFDEGYASEIGSADYCRRVGDAGKRIVQMCTVKVRSDEKCPELHYDNATNAPDFTLQDLERFDEKWPGVRAAGDPYFNCNLDQSSSYFQVARS